MTVDTGQGTSALVAMGDQGVVVVESDATASGISVVGWVHPTPFTKGFSGYRLEMLAAIGAGLLLFWILSAIAVVKTRTARRPKEGNVGLVLGVIIPAIIAVIAVGAPIFVAGWFVLYPVWVIAGWSGVGKAVPPDMGRLFRITFFGSLVVMLGTLALFELWARGGVNSHELTGRISLGFGLAAARLVTDNWEHRDAPSTTGWCAGPDGRRLDPLEVPPFQSPREGSCELLHFTPET